VDRDGEMPAIRKSPSRPPMSADISTINNRSRSSSTPSASFRVYDAEGDEVPRTPMPDPIKVTRSKKKSVTTGKKKRTPKENGS
jgi:hypothetical protein